MKVRASNTKVFLHYPTVVIAYIDGNVRVIRTADCKVVLQENGAKLYERVTEYADAA